MLDVLSVTSPIYITILIGYLATHAGLFAKTDLPLLGRFVTHVALPALLFRSLSQRSLGEILHAGYLVAYVVASVGTLAVGWLWCRRVGHLDRDTTTFRVMGMCCSNSGFVGYPILLLTLPAVAGVSLALNMVVENLIVIPLLLAIAEQGRGKGSAWVAMRQAFARLAANPMVMGLVAGFAVSLLGWKLPAFVDRSVNLMAMACGAVSLFVIGGTLYNLPLRGMGGQVTPVMLGKLLVHPALTLLAVLALPWVGLPAMDPQLRMAAVLMAAMPMMGIYPLLAQPYGHGETSAAAMLVTTIASFFSLSGLLWLLHHLPAAG